MFFRFTTFAWIVSSRSWTSHGLPCNEVNLKLSEQRALSVKTYLVSQGVDEDQLVAKGYGESQPIADNKTEEGRAKNRRVEIVVAQGEDAPPENEAIFDAENIENSRIERMIEELEAREQPVKFNFEPDELF